MKGNEKPLIAVTMGDVNGVGPEISVRAVLDAQVGAVCRPVIVGSARAAREAAELQGLSARVAVVAEPGEGDFRPGVVNVIETGVYDESSLARGEMQALAGRMSVDFIMKSIELGMRGAVRAVATAPINKRAIKLAGVSVPGHTELYEMGTGRVGALTMFQCGGLRVFFLSRHVSLRDALGLITRENIAAFLARADGELRLLGLSEPVIAVAALNPHGGDGGLFGDEEEKQIAPALQDARAAGILCEGPIAADSVFHLAKTGRFDAVLSLYHDQGHIACKTLDFERTVALTLGLPFLRTSVDHGTAFDIAWRGAASSVSMIEAILVASRYS